MLVYLRETSFPTSKMEVALELTDDVNCSGACCKMGS